MAQHDEHEHDSGPDFEEDGIWHWHWRQGRWCDPLVRWHAGVWGDHPDIEAAHAAVDVWAEAAGVEAALPLAGPYSPWWRIRFLLVHEELTALLPVLRSIQQQRAAWGFGLQAIEVHGPTPRWTAPMLRLLFPEVPVHVHPSPKDDLAARVNRAAARVVKGAVSWYRALRLWSGGASPRVLVVSRANAWDGVRDREMASTLDALRAEGMEPLVLEQSHGTFAGQWRGLWERPASHLFGDLFHLQYRIHGPRSMPMRQPISHVPLMFEGIDLRPLAEAFVTAQAEHQAREHDTYLQVLPNWLRRWGVSVVVTCDENGGEHALKAAALLAGVPVIAVQHGCIHAHHLHYAYPQHCTPEDIPLASITCVYGEHEQGLLAALGIYASESIEVTGQPQNDLRDHVERPWGERGAAGTRLRDDAMQDTGGTLLLLTSQDLYHGLAAEVLLPALQACPDSVKLVVRPHPREGDGAHWQDYFATYGVSERAVVVANGKLEYWLDACDVHVSVCSTVLAEAAVWGRPSLVLAPRAVGDWLGVLEAGVAIPFDQGADLQTALADVDAATSAFQVARSNYIQRHFGALDGKTGRRIAAIIRHSISIS